MELMNQPFTGQLGNRLIALLDSQEYHTLNIVVAFAKNSGVLRIKDSLESFRERGGVVNAYVGIDLGGTSYDALTALRICTNSLNVVHTEKGQTFHTKIYQFLGNDKGLIVVGSHNLTGGGLWTNFESSVIISVARSNTDKENVLMGLDDYIGRLTSLKNSYMSISAQDDIDNLLQNGYIFKEVDEQVRLVISAKQGQNRARLFGNGVSAKLPRVKTSNENNALAAFVDPAGAIDSHSNGEDPTIWFETRSMTGGSTNILDLSKKSLVERGNPEGTPYDLGDPGFMRGTVEFFGQNPADISQIKNITLNFEGINYKNNTIIYPEGDRKNGTWRLQLRGIGPSQKKLTEAFKNKGGTDYLKHKVITFTKIKDDYYDMSVLPGSALDKLKVASRILARNGPTSAARQVGLL